jgi:hypothetical protein
VEKYGGTRQATDGNIIQRMRFACWNIKATDTHSENVILIAFTGQQRLRERAPLLCVYVHCLACLNTRLSLSVVQPDLISHQEVQRVFESKFVE